MVTLSDFKVEFLKVARWAGIIFGIIMIIYIVVQIFTFFANSSKNNQPTATFGKLTKIDFPKGIDNNFTYSLDTISGALPSIPSQTTIYKMVKGEPDLLAVNNTGDKVAALGFKNGPTQISDTLYKWTSQDSLPRSITVNVYIPQFTLASDYTTDKQVIAAVSLPDQTEASTKAKDFLGTLGFLPDNIDDSATKIKYLRIQNGTLVEASSLSTAQLVSVYFFQKKNNVPFAYPSGDLSTLNLTFGSSNREPIIVDARFFAQTVSGNSGTYPLITISEAYDRLKSGKGYVASYNSSDKNVYIKKAYLAYFIEGKEQDYLEPVVVFEGNNNFMAYIPALRDEWVSN